MPGLCHSLKSPCTVLTCFQASSSASSASAVGAGDLLRPPRPLPLPLPRPVPPPRPRPRPPLEPRGVLPLLLLQHAITTAHNSIKHAVQLEKFWDENLCVNLISTTLLYYKNPQRREPCPGMGVCVLLLYGHQREEASLLGTLIDGQHRQKREQRGTQRGTATAKLLTPSLHL